MLPTPSSVAAVVSFDVTAGDRAGLTDLLKAKFASGRKLKVTAKASDGKVKEFTAKVRIDTPQEIEYYEHGGILLYVLRQLAAK